jgi:DNA-binding HxlR family transcriptional regulator
MYIFSPAIDYAMTREKELQNEILELLDEKGRFNTLELTFELNERHIVRQMLREIEQDGILVRESEHSQTWRIAND